MKNIRSVKMGGSMKKYFAAVTAIVIAGTITALFVYGRSILAPLYHRLVGMRTTADVVANCGPIVDARLLPSFHAAGVQMPPRKITLVGLKEEKVLELWAEDNGRLALIKTYKIQAASGGSGPKLRKGDRQVPEGMYRVETLNPNSSYHLSIRLNYPNEVDRHYARAEGRTNPGGDIYIHGKAVSIGCLAMGDDAIEELFVLASRVGIKNISVIVAPRDLRLKPAKIEPGQPDWVSKLYADIQSELQKYSQ